MKNEDVKVGMWYYCCCLADLMQIESREELYSIIEEIQQEERDGDITLYKFFDSELDAYRHEFEHLNELNDSDALKWIEDNRV